MAEHKQNYIFYGSVSSATQVREFVEHILHANLAAEAKGRKKSPICIWGTHGIGKTELVQQIAEGLGFQWAYIAPAQFEEMGDLVGMPTIEKGKTTFCHPSWVPNKAGPGILLIDDVNRADDRILRGIMQLLQNYELVSWSLPPKWQIVLTANPDGGDYSVTPMDDAMLTRMLHVTMTFNPKAWASWAESAGVDSRCINFVLTYPEIVQGERTTPRSLVQFFQSIEDMEEFSEHLPMIQMLGDACLDSETVASFINFVGQNLAKLPDPETMLAAKNFTKEIAAPLKKVVKQDILRVDIIATLCTRMVNHVMAEDNKLSKSAVANLIEFIKMDFIPNDLRLTLLQDIATSPKKSLQAVLADPEVADILLGSM